MTYLDDITPDPPVNHHLYDHKRTTDRVIGYYKHTTGIIFFVGEDSQTYRIYFYSTVDVLQHRLSHHTSVGTGRKSRLGDSTWRLDERFAARLCLMMQCSPASSLNPTETRSPAWRRWWEPVLWSSCFHPLSVNVGSLDVLSSIF